ncbi:MAG: energy-coupling factor transporter ATPase [Tissierellia bacterium]|nr:energy-coupling factor transporter ATPase [Tissierellia bacterium]
MNKLMVDMKDVSFYYQIGEDENEIKAAVSDVSLQIPKGEFIAILGHNGSGKSTLAKLMNGLLQPAKGTVLVDGMDTKSGEYIWKIRSKAGMVFQNPDNQLVATVVEEDVAFGPENLGLERQEIRKRVDQAIDIVGMTEYKKTAPHLLSGGQKQRVAIAGILAMSPDCIILDEPTAMLDPTGRREVNETIMRLHKEEGKTIILITHFMDEAAKAERVCVMNKGKIVLDDVPKNVFSKVDFIKSLGLDVPQVTELSKRLIESGKTIPEDILTVDEFVEAICSLK